MDGAFSIPTLRRFIEYEKYEILLLKRNIINLKIDNGKIF